MNKQYVYCFTCNAIITGIHECMKLVIGCDKELVCPYCEKHINQDLIAFTSEEAITKLSTYKKEEKS